jgi:hypothetical protein
VKCAACKFWNAPGGNKIDAGECRKSPPLVIVMQGQGLARGQVAMQFQSYWPPVGPSMWCGAFEPQIGTA